MKPAWLGSTRLTMMYILGFLLGRRLTSLAQKYARRHLHDGPLCPALRSAASIEVLSCIRGDGQSGTMPSGVELTQHVLVETQSAILPLVPYLDTLWCVFIAVALG